jgi:trigger factor
LDTVETTTKDLEGNKVQITVTIPASDVDKGVAAAYKEASRARIPGFRPGKAPRTVLDHTFGGKEYFLATATEDLVNETAPLAIDEHGYVALKSPEFADDMPTVGEGADFVYDFTLEVTPSLELSNYDNVQIELPTSEASESEIEDHIKSLMDYYVDYQDVDSRGAIEGDLVSMKLTTTLDGEAMPGLDGQERVYEMGSSGMPEGFDGNIEGMKVGESKTFDVEVKNDMADAPAKPQTMHCEVEVTRIRMKELPELTDAWVKETIEFDSVDELRTRVAESIKARKEADLPPLKDMLCSQRIAERLVGEVPEDLVSQTEQNNYRDFFNQLQRSQHTLDQYLMETGVTPDAFRESMHEEALENAKTALALDALARHLKMEATDEEVADEFTKAGVSDPEGLMENWRKQGRLSEIREGLLRMKASKYLVEHAEVFEPGTLPAQDDKADKAEAKPKKKAAPKKAKKEEADKAGEEE